LLTATFTGQSGWEKRRRGDKETRRIRNICLNIDFMFI
jgi:hypothetical protein